MAIDKSDINRTQLFRDYINNLLLFRALDNRHKTNPPAPRVLSLHVREIFL